MLAFTRLEFFSVKDFDLFKKVTLAPEVDKRFRRTIAFSDFHKYCEQNKLGFDDAPELIKRMSTFSPAEMSNYKNLGQQDKRNFLSLRVFSAKLKNEMMHYEVQKKSLAG